MEFNRAKKDFLFFKNSRIHSFKKKLRVLKQLTILAHKVRLVD